MCGNDYLLLMEVTLPVKPNKGYSNSFLPSIICNFYMKHKLLSVSLCNYGQIIVYQVEALSFVKYVEIYSCPINSKFCRLLMFTSKYSCFVSQAGSDDRPAAQCIVLWVIFCCVWSLSLQLIVMTRVVSTTVFCSAVTI